MPARNVKLDTLYPDSVPIPPLWVQDPLEKYTILNVQCPKCRDWFWMATERSRVGARGEHDKATLTHQLARQGCNQHPR